MKVILSKEQVRSIRERVAKGAYHGAESAAMVYADSDGSKSELIGFAIGVNLQTSAILIDSTASSIKKAVKKAVKRK